MREAEVVAARMLSPTVRGLTLQTGSDFRFEPGQWVNLFVPAQDGAEPLRRAYSIASPPRGDGRFELMVTYVSGGPVSTWLHAAPVGARLRVSDAQGFFVLEPILRPILLVATGTGVAPFCSMLNHYLPASLIPERAASPAPLPPITLLFGVRTAADILYRDELEKLARDHASFSLQPTLSRADDAWTGSRGYVQTHLAEIVASLGGGTACDAYVCGLTRMVHDVRRILRENLGFDRKRVHIERYD